MRQEIELYLDNKQIIFSEPPEVLFTFCRTDYTNPTLIKNSFTKTVTIEGTPENNKVFGEIYLLGRTQNELMYNPSKRVPFQLFSNGDLVETGYAKLDNVIKDGYKIKYEVTLYGGLGDFFYGLSYGFDYDDYDSDTEQTKDEELKLKDLTYYSPSADDDTEFNFNITKDAVYNAWRVLGGYTSPTGDNEKWKYINFAPAYNGLPDDFDSNKVLINTSGYTGGCKLSVQSGATVDGVTYTGQTIAELQTIPTGITIDGTSYTTANGYAMAELRENLTEWEIRDLRSYLQRPVLRVKGFIEAVQRYAREKGDYTLNLDSDFFNANNPYYDKAWITLPMLQNLNGEYAEQEAEGVLQLGLPSEERTAMVRKGDWNTGTLVTSYDVYGLPFADTMQGASITIKFSTDTTLVPPLTQIVNELRTSYMYYNSTDNIYTLPDYLSNYDFQLIAYDNNNNVVNSSEHHLFTSLYWGANGNRGYFDKRWSSLYPITNSIEHRGTFKQNTSIPSGDVYVWHDEDNTNSFTISLKKENVQFNTLKLVITKNFAYTDAWERLWSDSPDFYTAQLSYILKDDTSLILCHSENYILNVVKSSVIFKPSDAKMKSNQLITKSKLLSQDGTPADYLISYCKLFNLYFDKDPIDKVITIRTRANFYDGNVIDLEDKIDRSKEIKITPIASDNKWYNFNYTQGDKAEMENRYYNTWGTDFGKQKVKTEYNFDNSSKDLLEGNIYNNGITVQEKSKYYVTNLRDSKVIPTFMLEWSDFKLFRITQASVETPDEFYISQPTLNRTLWYNGSDGGRYDFYPKLQLHATSNDPIDGSNVLVFYGGTETTVCSSGGTGYNVFFNITDDLGEMYSLNGEQTCWLYTNTTTDALGRVIARRTTNTTGRPILPVFNRYIMSGTNIETTWDFGKCNELFVPNVTYIDGNPTIYDKYWKQYVSDLYHTTTRVVECYVKMDGKVEGDWLKHFYYFDDSIWCLTKIEDYNITSFDTTKCQFVKVGDINDYRYWYTN